MFQIAHEVRAVHHNTNELNPPSQLLALEPRYLFDAAALVSVEAVVPAIIATDESYSDPFYSAALNTAEDTPLDIPAFVLIYNDGDFGLTIDSVAAIAGQTNGTVELLNNGNVLFTPDQDFNGEASFTYTITNDIGNSDTATVTLLVTPQNDTPTTTGIDNLDVTTETSSSALDLTTYFSDADQDPSSLTYSIQSNSNPDLFSSDPSIDASGVLNLNYAANATGSATFTVQAVDDLGTSIETSFTVTVSTPVVNELVINDTTQIVTPANAVVTSITTSSQSVIPETIETTNILGDALNDIASESASEQSGSDTGDAFDITPQENNLVGLLANASPEQQNVDAAAIQQLIAQGSDPSAVAPAAAAGTPQVVSQLAQQFKVESEAFSAERAEVLGVLRDAAQFLHCSIQK